MKIECPNCGSDLPDLPNGTTEHQARIALRAVLLWYGESPIREIQVASAVCGMPFPIDAIKGALTRCGCKPCGLVCHASDCAVHNLPAAPAGLCNCGALPDSNGDRK